MGAIKKQEESKGNKGKKPPAKPNMQPMDADLVRAMEKRLANLEGLVKAQRTEIKRKTEQLVETEAELEKLRKEIPLEKVKKYRQAKSQNDEILKENNEIKAFMKEYGYNWDEKSGEFNMSELKENLNIKGPAYRNDLPKEIDLRIIMRRIEALNTIAEVDAKRINESNGVHSLGIHDPLNIRFYKNGIILDGFPFHPYHSREAQGMLSDILDGYFPYDLKRKYPEGVPLKVVNNTTEKYESKGVESKGIQIAREVENEESKVIPKGDSKAVGTEETKQPQTTSVPIPQQGSVTIETTVSKQEQEGKSVGETVTFRIRTENGKLNLFLKLLASDTIKSVYNYVKPYR